MRRTMLFWFGNLQKNYYQGRPLGYVTFSRLLHYWCSSKDVKVDIMQKRSCNRLVGHEAGNLRYLSDMVSSTPDKQGDIDAIQGMGLNDIIKKWVDVLTTRQIPEPTHSVHLIVAHAVGKKMIHEVDRCLTPSAEVIDNIHRMCKQRLDRWPVQYIIGEWDFHDMTLKMKPPVLIPRPETEELAMYVVEERKKISSDHDGLFLDIGCGSGVISLFILNSLPRAVVVAVDKSETACELTLHNAREHNLQDRLHVLNTDIFSDCIQKKLASYGPYNVIVSNPPYVLSHDMKTLEDEIYRYEDHGALHGGADGLDVIRRILSLASGLLEPEHGHLWLEVDLSHPHKIEELVSKHPEYNLQYLETVQDYSKRGRFCKLKTRWT